MNDNKTKWLHALGKPSYEIPNEPLNFVKKYEYEEFDIEVYLQKNDPETSQRTMFAFPKNLTSALPAVVIPFYFPEAMLGFDPETGKTLEKFSEIPMMVDLVKRGYIVASADAYHLTYIENPDGKIGLDLWFDAGKKLREDHPCWSGMGKLVSDTMLLVGAVANDSRVDSSRIGIIGHSLGGKMAFYTGCLDDRVKVIAASDFGIGWDQTNWNDVWYWHDKVCEFKENGTDHSELLGIAAPKPFCLIAGQYDDESSYQMILKAPGYTPDDERIKFINHATGHRPPEWALEEAYSFIDRWL